MRKNIGAASMRWIRGLTIVFFVLYCLTAQGVVGRSLNDVLERASVPTYGIFALLIAFVMAVFPQKAEDTKGAWQNEKARSKL